MTLRLYTLLSLSYLKAVFNRLIKIDEWQGVNPLRSVEKLKFREQELSFLTLDEMQKLLNELEKGRNADALLVAKVCLCTGARWGEVTQLTKSQVRNDRVTFVKTKNNEQRTVPMDKSLCSEVQTRLSTAPFSLCNTALRHAIRTLAITLRYSHLAPEYLNSALVLNPIALLQQTQSLNNS
jgi:integrase